MLQRVRTRRPDATLLGFSVQQMVTLSHGRELIVGSAIDPLFGPVVLFGHGGTAVEVLADRAVGLPPLNEPLARSLVGRTRVARLLGAWRDTSAVDHQALYGVLVTVSQLLADVPEIAELDINPLIASPSGVVALDARIRASAACPAGESHFAIRPYPAQLVETVAWHGREVTLRPIRPEDEAQHLEFLSRVSAEDIRMRVFYSRRSIERTELARLTQIDYAREMAFVATEPRPEGGEFTLGVARAVTDPDNDEAEFGVLVRSDLKHSGLGLLLMEKLIAYLRGQGTRRVVAVVLEENDAMRGLGKRLGFREGPPDRADGTRRIWMDL
jgi:acetyltransferase